MEAIVLKVVACLPHSNQCQSLVQRPTPLTQEECRRRAQELVGTLTGTIDDRGYMPIPLLRFHRDACTEEIHGWLQLGGDLSGDSPLAKRFVAAKAMPCQPLR